MDRRILRDELQTALGGTRAFATDARAFKWETAAIAFIRSDADFLRNRFRDAINETAAALEIERPTVRNQLGRKTFDREPYAIRGRNRLGEVAVRLAYYRDVDVRF